MKKIIILMIAAVIFLTGCSSIDENDPRYIIYQYAQDTGYTDEYDTWLNDFSSGSVEFRLVNDDLQWKYKIRNEWNDLYVLEESIPTWYRYLVGGDLDATLFQYYTVEFYSDFLYETQIILKNDLATDVSITKDGYIFNGWYEDTLFDFNTKITKPTKLTANWLIDGIMLNDFTYDDGIYYLDVDNDIENLDLNDYVSTDFNWTVNDEDNKTVQLVEGENTFTLKSFTEETKEYTITINRLRMFNVTYVYEYTNKDISDSYLDTIQEKSILDKEDYDVKGYTFTSDYDFTKEILSDTVITFTYTPNEYNISFDVLGGTDVDSIKVEFDSVTMLNNTTKVRYVFLGWTYEGDLINSNFLMNIDSDITLVALYKENDYLVDYELDGGENDSRNPYGYEEDTNDLNLYAATKTGYTFIGWYTDSEFTNQITKIDNNSKTNYTLYAKYEANTYVITFNVLGGNELDTFEVIYDQSYELPVASKEDFFFGGWFYNDLLFENGIWKIDSNITLIAYWFVYDYLIYYDIDRNLNPNNQLGYDEGDLVVLQKPLEVEGYTFISWYTDESFTNKIEYINGTGDVYLYAYYKANTYNITFDLNGGTMSYDNIDVEYDANYSFEVPKLNGYRFTGWYYNNELVNDSIWKIASDIELIATWVAYDYLVTFVSETDNNEDNRTGYDSGDSFLLYNPSDKVGYTFIGWYIGSEMFSAVSSGTIGNLEFTAKFEANTYVITYDNEGITQAVDVDYDSIIDYINVSRVGYTFTGWYLNGVLFDDITYTIDDNITLVSRWELIEYNITYELNDGVNNEDNINIYTIETIFVLLDATREYDIFLGWYIGDELCTDIEIDSIGDLVLEAKFEAVEYTINYVLNGGAVTIENVVTFSYDDIEIELFSPRITGYNFAYWCYEIELTNRVLYLNHDVIKQVFEDYNFEDSNYVINLYAKYTNDIVERIIFSDNDHRGYDREYMYFGFYPQTIVGDEDIISNLKLIDDTNEFGYYVFNGEQYAKVDSTNSYNTMKVYSNGKNSTVGETAYFKVEPIKWRVLSTEEGTMLISEYILDTSMYNDSINSNSNGYSANNYAESVLRSFLNNDFYNKAFGVEQQRYLEELFVDNSGSTTSDVNNPNASNDTYDYVYTLSYTDVLDTNYGFFPSTGGDLSREAIVSDYAIANYCFVNDGAYQTGDWWLRSPNATASAEGMGTGYLSVITSYTVTKNSMGVRPCITL